MTGSQQLTPAEIRKFFPFASKGLLEANTDQPPTPIPKTIPRPVSAQKKGLPQTLRIVISNQIMGGKNNMIVTRSGLHFPKKNWAKWRDEKVAEVKAQLPTGWTPIDSPCEVTLGYVAGDRRRRDMPAIIDSIYHVLEKAGVVADDTHLWVTSSSKGYDPKSPRAEITLTMP